jgi:hypothetical protein
MILKNLSLVLYMKENKTKKMKGGKMNFCDSCDRRAVTEISDFFICEYLECEMFIAELIELEG